MLKINGNKTHVGKKYLGITSVKSRFIAPTGAQVKYWTKYVPKSSISNVNKRIIFDFDDIFSFTG